MTETRGRNQNFPNPSEATDQNPVVWRSTEDMVEIANEMNNWTNQNLCQINKEWILGHAITLGWGAVHFPLAYPSKSAYAGAVFIKK